MTEKRPGPAPGVRLVEVSVKRELTVNALKLMHYCLTFHFRSAEVIRPLFCFELLDYL